MVEEEVMLPQALPVIGGEDDEPVVPQVFRQPGEEIPDRFVGESGICRVEPPDVLVDASRQPVPENRLLLRQVLRVGAFPNAPLFGAEMELVPSFISGIELLREPRRREVGCSGADRSLRR